MSSSDTLGLGTQLASLSMYQAREIEIVLRMVADPVTDNTSAIVVGIIIPLVIIGALVAGAVLYRRKTG